MHVEKCVCACVHIYACVHMYDVLVSIRGGEEGSDWVKAGDKCEEGELTSLASHCILWDRYV